MLKHFSITHILIILAIPLVAWGLSAWAKGNPKVKVIISFILAGIIGLNELIWYVYVIAKGWFSFPDFIPIDLCDIVLWLTFYTLLTIKQWSFDFIYYWGLAGTSMAVLTPDIAGPFPSYVSIKFLLAHGCVVLSILYLVWSKSATPTRKSWRKAYIWVNIYAGLIGLFNLIFNTNYFYLCSKPASGSLLDYMGPWPVYIFAGQILGLLLFILLYLPYGKKSQYLK